MTDVAMDDIDNVADLLSFLDVLLVCVTADTTSEQNLVDLGGNFTIVASTVPLHIPYDADNCDVMSGDKSLLAAQKGLVANPDQQLIFQVTISKEPLGPVTRYGDQQWSDIVN